MKISTVTYTTWRLTRPTAIKCKLKDRLYCSTVSITWSQGIFRRLNSLELSGKYFSVYNCQLYSRVVQILFSAHGFGPIKLILLLLYSERQFWKTLTLFNYTLYLSFGWESYNWMSKSGLCVPSVPSVPSLVSRKFTMLWQAQQAVLHITFQN